MFWYLGETQHEHQIDGDESEQISHDHAVYHHYEGTNCFEATGKIYRRGLQILTSV